MKILLAPDKFKGSISAHEVCEALSKGIQKVHPNMALISKPLADGGDGSLAVLDHYFTLKTINKIVQDPLGRPIKAHYKMTDKSAYIEMSVASGLALLNPAERNCMNTTSYGTGELIRDAFEKGATTIFLFIGGSATNDGGIGIGNALGYQFYDSKGQLLAPIGRNLVLIDRIEKSSLSIDLKSIQIKVVCDVNNPFYGKNGAAYIYAPQKGANREEVIHLDRGLKNLAKCLTKYAYSDIATVSGAGAAGGVGGGAMAFLNAQLQSGIQTFLDITEIESVLKNCDLIITGEGKIDTQTEQGKVISGVCQLAQKYDKPVIAVCGDADFPISKTLGIQAVYTIRSRSNSLEEAMQTAADKVEAIGESIAYKIST